MPRQNITPKDMVEAYFCVAVMGQSQSARIVHGWNALIDEVEHQFYGVKPKLQDRVTIVKELSNWADWVPDFTGLPFHKMTQRDDDMVYCEIFRMTDIAHLSEEKKA